VARARYSRSGRQRQPSCGGLGLTYLKLGRLDASIPGLFPEMLAEESRACLDRVAPVPVADVAVELDAPRRALRSLRPEPLAAASCLPGTAGRSRSRR
jgi:predicted unusual protein kinase regulating ubiquinone biosynthesis (AarF/ABC1/UbiB family)